MASTYLNRDLNRHWTITFLYKYSRQEEQLRAAAAAEARRQEQEREEREKKRYASELAAMKERHLRERIAHISQTMHGKKVLQKLDEEVCIKMNIR